jgi:hypothetical protein
VLARPCRVRSLGTKQDYLIEKEQSAPQRAYHQEWGTSASAPRFRAAILVTHADDPSRFQKQVIAMEIGFLQRFESRARVARLRQSASIEDVDYRAARGLDRALFRKLATCEWIHTRRNLIITGPCGVGKSWLAYALGTQGLQRGLLSSLSSCPGALHRPRSSAPRRSRRRQ